MDFLFKNRNASQNNETEQSQQPQQNIVPEVREEYKGPVLVGQTNYSVTKKEKHGVFEYIDFKVSGTSFYQNAIKKAIKEAKENNYYFDEKYDGMTNKEILENTYDEPVFEYSNGLFPNGSLKLEPENEHDPNAIAIYIDSFLVGYVPEKNFSEGKKYIYNQLTGGLKHNQNLNFSVTLRGGKYKINRNDEKVDTGESDYKLDGQVTIKTELN